VAPGIVADENTLHVAEKRLLEALRLRHAETPTRPFVALRPIQEEAEREFSRDLLNAALLALRQAGLVRIRDGEAALTAHDPSATLSTTDIRQMERIEDALKVGGLDPPDIGDLLQGLANGQMLLDILLAKGDAVDLYNHALRRRVILHVASLETARLDLSVRFPKPGRFTTGEAREALGTTRRIIVPLLERLDQLGYTRREGDTRTLCDPTESRAQTKSS
jgi:selenocysteine-specific elongation factor